MGVYEISGYRLCEVISVDDETDARRIKVRLKPEDNKLSDDELPYAVPLLPKVFHIMPKVGESVYVITRNSQNAYSERAYIGPIISQDNHIFYDSYELEAFATHMGSRISPEVAESLKPLTKGAYAGKEDVAVYGRKYSDVILTENDVRLRSGVRLVNDKDPRKVQFNSKNPAFVKLKYNPEQQTADNDTYNSTAAVVADKVLLLGNVPKDGNIITADSEELITDERLNELIEKAHELPYGDKLVEFLKMFVDTFVNHVHPFPTMKPCQTNQVNNLKSYDLPSLLSNSIRIN